MPIHPNERELDTKTTTNRGLPEIASRAEWQKALDKLLVKEKATTRARDALAAERRRLPMVKIEKDYIFEGPDGKVSLLNLFEGRRQLIIYHFMFAPGVSGWPTAGCDGCSMVVDQVGHLAHFHARNTSFCLVSPPLYRSASARPPLGQRLFVSERGDRLDFGGSAGWHIGREDRSDREHGA